LAREGGGAMFLCHVRISAIHVHGKPWSTLSCVHVYSTVCMKDLQFTVYSIDKGVVYRWARKMEDEGTASNSYSWSSRYGQKVTPEHTIFQYIACTYNVQAHDFQSISIDWISCTVCIRLSSLVFHFAGSSIYNSCIYGLLLYNVCYCIYQRSGKDLPVFCITIC